MSAHEKAAGVLDTPTTANFKIDTPIVAPNRESEKSFATMAAQFAMQGHTLHQTNPTNGAVTYYAERWGLIRYLPTLDDTRRFLAQIGGAA